MTTKHKAARLAEQQLVRERTEAYHDARALALEFASGEASTYFDPMVAGVVLQPGETVYRQVPLWIRILQNGYWAEANYAVVLVTDMRLLGKLATGNEVHRSRRGRGRICGDPYEAQHDVHRQPNSAGTLWLQKWVHAGEIPGHRYERGERCRNEG